MIGCTDLNLCYFIRGLIKICLCYIRCSCSNWFVSLVSATLGFISNVLVYQLRIWFFMKLTKLSGFAQNATKKDFQFNFFLFIDYFNGVYKLIFLI